MYLMNAPPFAATRTEWRTCGPAQDFSLHGFNSSDSELSTSDTNIQDKVQMIIKSLRSTQSSVDMGDEIEGQEVHLEACKFGMSPIVGSKLAGSTENQQTHILSPIKSKSQDSDSDDSVDRGIEEAILEYLKEKDGNKRKAEPSTNILQPSKVHRKNAPIPEVSRQHSDSNLVLSASDQLSKSHKVETPMASANSATNVFTINTTPFKENPVKKDNGHKKSLLPTEPKNVFSLTNIYKKVHGPVTVKEELHSPDSSSDDGIEEAIQKYQLEKKDKQNRSKEACKSLTSQEPSDSSSDDGIEEAIRCYQLEQLKEKSGPKPFVHKPQPIIKSSSVESTSTENIKRLKSKKKRKTTDGFPPLSVLPPQSTFIGSSNGNGLVPSKEEPFVLHTLASTKVNTSAELMCAEAILDISKAVMPEVFSANVGLGSFSANHSLSAPPTSVDDRSCDSSIDSEDGIEQEIRKFLEQKAQMQKQPETSASEPGSVKKASDKTRGKREIVQKKVLRLSLTRRRKSNEDRENSPTSRKMKEELHLTGGGQGSSSLMSSQIEQTPPSVDLDKTEQGDKSSSLDSDEDLDTAIKDLLKTKKKLKKKTRDLKLKTRKCLKEAAPCDTVPTKQAKLDPVSKRVILKKAPLVKTNEMTMKAKLSKKGWSSQKQIIKSTDTLQVSEMDRLKGTGSVDSTPLYINEATVQVMEDSSSVDSDDSIEQEIRKFLAEKAKVSTADKNKDRDAPSNGSVGTQYPDNGIKLESQLAEVPITDTTHLPDGNPDGKLFQDEEALTANHISPHKTPLTLGTTCHSSLLSHSASLMQATDWAGAAKEPLRPSIGSPEVNNANLTARARPATSPSVFQSCPDAIKWRQSLGLLPTNKRALWPNRPPIYITTPPRNDAAVARPHHVGRADLDAHTPATPWSSARGGRPVAPVRRSPETPLNTVSNYFSNPLSTTTQSPGRSLLTVPASGSQRTESPVSGQADRENHLAGDWDQGALTRLEMPGSCQGQVQGRHISEGKIREEREKGEERESTAAAEKAVQTIKTEEDFLDVTDCELSEGRSQREERRQEVSNMFLSKAIDPGIPLETYIDLASDERVVRFTRRCRKGNDPKNKTLEDVKRKLKFVSALYV